MQTGVKELDGHSSIEPIGYMKLIENRLSSMLTTPVKESCGDGIKFEQSIDEPVDQFHLIEKSESGDLNSKPENPKYINLEDRKPEYRDAEYSEHEDSDDSDHFVKLDVYRLELILGPMGSGKSTELGRRLKQRFWKKCLAITHSDDTRYGEEGIITHDKIVIPAIRVKNLNELLSKPEYKSTELVGIDEAQFFPDVVEFILEQLKTTNKSFILGGLAGDKNRQVFGNHLQLVPEADDITFLRAKCRRCSNGTDAPFTIELVSFEGQKRVGGMGDYEAVCRHHYNTIRYGQTIDNLKRSHPELKIYQ